MSNQRRRIKFFLPTLFLLAVAPVCAQGGKAEPLRIEFKPGASSATLRGAVRNDEQAEYVFAARKGQRVTINLASTPARSALFNLESADGLKKLNSRSWTGRASATGDFLLYVFRPGRGAGRSLYALTLRIK